MNDVAKHNHGFTLMELLVVMAISIILMGLVLYPVAKSFELTRNAQAMVEAQDSARISIERIGRELGEAMDVLDYTAEPLEIPVADTAAGATIPPIYWLRIPSAKIDFVLPRMLVHCGNPDTTQHPDGQPRDFPRGGEALPACPICNRTEYIEIRPRLPLEQDVTVVRYFLGLRYNNPTTARAKDDPPYFGWESPWGKNVAADAGNQVVLYRIEFDPTDTTIFSSDANQAVQELAEVLNDPRFFYSEQTVPGSRGSSENLKYWQAWAEKARIVGMGKYEDLVTAVDSDVSTPRFEALEPSITFKYAKVDNDTFAGSNPNDKSSEYPNAVPTVYRAKYGFWLQDPFTVGVYTYQDVNQNGTSSVNITDYSTAINGNNDLVIVKNGGAEVFNISEYMRTGYIPPETEMAFYFDFARGGGQQILNLGRGTVNFALDPRDPTKPNDPVCTLDPWEINSRFKSVSSNDRSSARRYAYLRYFDGNVPGERMTYATIVPGSEVVWGPDMTPGSDGSRLVRYERVPQTLGYPELNQYKIQYDTGIIEFSRVPDQNLPETGASIMANYKVQFNRNGDVVRGDYFTKSLVNIHVGIRMFDPDSAIAHTVELNNTVKIRNAMR
ncbi:MAG: type II secretion system GspH family protein [Armatimonadetes bacterium]|nr:type II secretion system GspH family protein [Armatimonadota bacterium]